MSIPKAVGPAPIIREDYRTYLLILLIGSNPLPNYVAAKLLLKDRGKILCVHTGATKVYAEAIAREFGASGADLVELRSEADPDHVAKKITERLEQIGAIKSIGLHYTGGTKVMAIHAYLAVDAYLAGQRIKAEPIMSYLDPHRLTLVIERKGRSPYGEKLLKVAELSSHLGMSLDTVWRLHDIALDADRPPRTSPILPSVVEKIGAHIAAGERKQWQVWAQPLDGKSTFEQCPFDDIRTAFARQNEPIHTIADLAQSVFKADIKSTGVALEWLKSKWFEDYVLLCMERTKGELGFTDLACSIQTDETYKNTPNFEVDIAGLRGYQLFVFSCSLEHQPPKCKEKLIEAGLRAADLGGDEARYAVVCCHPNPSEIKRAVRGLINPDRFEVFGQSDLASLGKRIESWLKRLDREATS